MVDKKFFRSVWESHRETMTEDPKDTLSKAWDVFVASPWIKTMRTKALSGETKSWVEFVRATASREIKFEVPEDEALGTRFVLIRPEGRKVDPNVAPILYSKESLAREIKSGCSVHVRQTLANRDHPLVTVCEERVTDEEGRLVCQIVEFKHEGDESKGYRTVMLNLGNLLGLPRARFMVYTKFFAEGGFVDRITGHRRLDDEKPAVVYEYDRETLGLIDTKWNVEPADPREKELFDDVASRIFVLDPKDEVKSLYTFCFKACGRRKKNQ